MQQATFANSSSSPFAAVLNPRIQKALSNLDSRLEDELARYRRYRAGLKVAPSSARAMHPKPKPDRVELATFAPIIGAHSVPSSVPAGSQAVGSVEGLDSPGDWNSTIASTSTALATDSALAVLPNPSDSAVPIDPLMSEEIEHNPYDLPMDFVAGDSDSHAATHHLPNDYLESSEALLRSLAEEEAQADLERGVLENLLTPLGVGSMLLMLLASGMFGYLVMNPSSLKAIAGLAGRAMTALRPQSNSQPVVQAPAASPTEEASHAFALDSQEFADLSLGNLTVLRTGRSGLASGLAVGKPGVTDKNKAAKSVPNGLVVMNPKLSAGKAVTPGNPSGSAAPGAAGHAQPSGIAPVFDRRSDNSGGQVRTTPLPQPRRFSPPTAGYRDPAPRYAPNRPSSIDSGTTPLPPAPLPPAPLPSVAPAPSNNPETPRSSGYKVVVPYDNDRTLEKVQQLDPNSYFRNSESGAVIQTGGSYNNEAEAQQKVQELKQQGIEAEVQK
ncbi:hypothetical protein [Alkalinema sp. FACHB-956]|uniref:hypothetical protein n=1 Tax=Alkalinema sp. FACHB-956 TaxID=2692768 RepID=UPI001684A356|nr:hypothetical protein [Alkalinema sp. FACHB-956]MBD2329442.1 hypothetical protein [Alkalinema sp. FACHB-956]